MLLPPPCTLFLSSSSFPLCKPLSSFPLPTPDVVLLLTTSKAIPSLASDIASCFVACSLRPRRHLSPSHRLSKSPSSHFKMLLRRSGMSYDSESDAARNRSSFLLSYTSPPAHLFPYDLSFARIKTIPGVRWLLIMSLFFFFISTSIIIVEM